MRSYALLLFFPLLEAGLIFPLEFEKVKADKILQMKPTKYHGGKGVAQKNKSQWKNKRG